MQNAAYRGLWLVPHEVTLVDGVWEGPPHLEGGASRTRVSFGGQFSLYGDLDGDGHDEAAVILDESGGGSGTFMDLAVLALRDGKAVNVATTPLGDRVQIRSGRIENGTLALDLVQAGLRDAACCPGDLVRRSWQLRGEKLDENGLAVSQGRLPLATWGGIEWVLRYETWEIPRVRRMGGAPAQPEVTLRFQDGRFAGSAGCNRYFAPVQPGAQPGDLTLGPPGSTHMMCGDMGMALEDRFLAQLGGVKKFGFVLGQLALTFEKDGAMGVMLFDSRSIPPE